jgi:hypothetical protein
VPNSFILNVALDSARAFGQGGIVESVNAVNCGGSAASSRVWAAALYRVVFSSTGSKVIRIGVAV